YMIVFPPASELATASPRGCAGRHRAAGPTTPRAVGAPGGAALLRYWGARASLGARWAYVTGPPRALRQRPGASRRSNPPFGDKEKGIPAPPRRQRTGA